MSAVEAMASASTQVEVGPQPAAAADDRYRRSTFQKMLHASFLTRTTGGWLTLQLTSVRDLPGASRTAAQREGSFSLKFTGAASKPLLQGTYTLSHVRLGRLDLLLVPMGRQGVRLAYEAVINQAPRQA
jgi:hypothetical protein